MQRNLPHRMAEIALVCLLWLCLTFVGATTAVAQTISNTANLNWPLGGQTVTVASNTVSFAVTQLPVTVNTYIAEQGAATVLAYQPSLCGGNSSGAGSSISPQSAGQANVTATSSISIGDSFYFSVTMMQANLHPNAIDTINVVLTTAGGDKEVLRVSETGVNTGVFAGSVLTSGSPATPVQGDCRLTVKAGDVVTIQPELPGTTTPAANFTINVLSDPYGTVFDSEDGTPVNGATVTLVDAATGQPATVYASDGVTSWPSSVVTGQTVTDGHGVAHPLAAGEYSFPMIGLGHYRIVITPPSPYKAPSALKAAQLANIKRPDGTPVEISTASYGGVLNVTSTQAVRVDVPVDRPAVAVAVTKVASVTNAQPGDLVYYTVHITNTEATHAKRAVVVTDTPSNLLRLRRDSVRIDGAAAGAAVTFAPDGSHMTIALGDMAGGVSHTITYAASVRASASAGRALNTVTATDILGASASASALVRIEEDGLTARMTLLGEVSDGGCVAKGPHNGIAGVRVMLEDGSFAITDGQGRYHFDDLVPGTHVAQVASSTLPEGGRFVNCGGGTRAADSPTSRFILGQGGSVMVANFRAELPVSATPVAAPKGAPKDAKDAPKDAPKDAVKDAAVREEQNAAGANTDWLAMGDGPIDFLFPSLDHNPRAPAVRVVIRHRPGQTIDLFANGKPVSKLTRDNVKVSADGRYAVSIWRGVPLDGEATELSALVHNLDGSLAAHIARTVHFNHVPFEARLIGEQTKLIADGRTRPVIAVRILDRNGRPVHAGLAGDVTISSPYESADAIATTQSRALSGLGRNTPHWVVKGEDGVALIELAPTMASGAISLDFAFADGEQHRAQTLEGWVKPGDVEWTLVGLAEGSVGARTIADAMERSSNFSSNLGRHARAAFYAKGRVLGKFLLTVAYDSAKQADDQTLMGAIDPKAYYTVYGDGSARRFDAASRDKLYLRIETSTFYAMYGDVQAGFNQTQLARYQRTVTGVKAEAKLGAVHLQGFGARTISAHRHDEIAGAGISGPYPLSSAAMLAGSETVTLEVRDRVRPDVIISSSVLTRYSDYTIDLLAGTITFKQPLLSRDANLEPQYAVIDYDVDTTLATANKLIGAARVDVTSRDKRLRVGATVISDANDTTRANEVAGDIRLMLDRKSEIRAEGAVSQSGGVEANAWLVEAEHHDAKYDVLAYARSADAGFGVGQTGSATLGHRRIGVDSRIRYGDKLSLATSLWLDDSLSDAETAKAADIKLQYRKATTQLSAGISYMDQTLADGTGGTTTALNAAYTRKFLDNKLELTAGAAAAIGDAGAASLPVRENVGFRYALSPSAKLTGTYEIATSSGRSTRTGRIGIDTQPWKGAHATLGAGQQDIAENGQRMFAAFGLTQSFDLTRHIALEASLDSNRVLSGSNLANLPTSVTGVVASSSSGSSTSTLVENFTAITAGLSWRKDLWSTSLRGEWRNGEWSDREGITAGAIRQLGDGKMVGAGATWAHAQGTDGSLTDVFDATLALAWRPQFATTLWLTRAEFRSDTAIAATTSGTGTATSASIANSQADAAMGSVLTNGNYAHARRAIVSVSADYSPHEREGDGFVERSELSLFVAMRHNFDAYDGYNLAGTTLMAGASVHIGLGDRVEVGGQFSAMASLADHTTNWSLGPSIGVVPAKNMLLMVGYNFAGYRDADFSAANNTTKGVFATLKMKFDTGTFGFLGLDKRVRH